MDTRFPPSVFDPVVTVPGSFLGTVPITGRSPTTPRPGTIASPPTTPSTTAALQASPTAAASGFRRAAGFLEIAWKASGSIELWDWKHLADDGRVKSKYFYKGDPMVTLTATRA
jgi:hypothetical protein